MGTIVYLASHNRPVHEVLFPAKRDIAQEFDGNFLGMTIDPVALEDLLRTREQILSDLLKTPAEDHLLPKGGTNWVPQVPILGPGFAGFSSCNDVPAMQEEFLNDYRLKAGRLDLRLKVACLRLKPPEGAPG